MRYRDHELLIAPARPGAALWRLVMGLIIAATGYIALNQMFFQMVANSVAATSPADLDFIFDGTSVRGMLILLGTFGFMILPLAVVARVMHMRGALTLLGPVPVLIRQFTQVTVMLLLLGLAIFILPPWDMGGELTSNMAFGAWALLLPFSLIAVLVQVSAEELLFRGYLQQQLAARFRSPLIWLVLPSGLFALGHYMPEEAGGNAMAVAIWAGVFGLLMADITARAGSLGPAIAIHLYNNAMAMLVVAMPGDLSALALYHAPFGLADEAQVRAWLPVDFAHMIVAWLAARLAIRR